MEINLDSVKELMKAERNMGSIPKREARISQSVLINTLLNDESCGYKNLVRLDSENKVMIESSLDRIGWSLVTKKLILDMVNTAVSEIENIDIHNLKEVCQMADSRARMKIQSLGLDFTRKSEFVTKQDMLDMQQLKENYDALRN